MSYNLDEVKKELEAKTAILLDIREQEEWDEGHLTQATLVPLSLIRDEEVPDSLDKSQKTYIHCRSGMRVQVAAPILEELGFANVIPLDEGFDDLALDGFEEA